MSWLQQYDASRSLPPGHVGRREAEERVNQEYAIVRKQEAVFHKRWKKRPHSIESLSEAKKLCNAICDALGVYHIKEVTTEGFEGLMRHAGGFYSTRRIHVRTNYVNLITLLHELAHHVCYMERMFKGGAHGEDFLMIEQLIFDLVLERPELVPNST